MSLSFKNKTYFEMAAWFIAVKVLKDNIDKYFKQELGPENSPIKSGIGFLILLISWHQV